ncbi:hypothetical protein BJ322DRAFT_1039159 [Thelephora terrestris]|uniref:Uncharacterized protein n=1 Tax=Thelephora terrestris TaxID=56493 RepID=A0A9P6HPM4_9AGAM|nr:hypothetical protein BJ322DRAFT_1039159 [Thelephora terrestris]
MLLRSLIKSSRATKPAFVQPVTPLLTRFITSSSNPASRTSAAKVKVAEGEAPLSKPPSDPNKLSARDLTEGTYEKGQETSPEPITTYSGTRSYVVNEPDPADSKYEIPTGAYHSTAPYEKLTEVKYERYEGERSSSSSEVAHPVTTKRVPRHEGGVGESAAVRFASSPGEMGDRGGGDGGLGLMDKEGTTEGVDWVLETDPRVGKA